jgi:hypothetical protein
MLKINASYSKKVPAELEYSSQSYHCMIESELPDGLTHEQLQERIHATFALVREAVEAELHGTQAPQPQEALPEPVLPPVPQRGQPPVQQMPGRGYAKPPAQGQQAQYQEARLPKNALASSKQINYLLSLAKRAGWSVQGIMEHCQVNRLEELGKLQCSDLIEQLNRREAS